MIDDSAVYLFGNTVVEAAISGFHMKDWNPSSRSDDRRKSAVRIAENEHAIGFLICKDFVALRHDLANLFAKGFRCYSKVNVRRANFEILDENIAQAFVIILTCVNRNMFAMLVEDLHHQTEPDNFRPRAEDGHYFHSS